MKELNRKTLGHLPTRPIKIVQFGEGNFLRAFVDWIIDLLNEKADFNGDVAVVQPLQQGMGALINQQDGLYHVLLEGLSKGKTIQKARLISCLSSVVNPYDDYYNYLKLAENPDLEIIFSNTTEAGITFEEESLVAGQCPKTFPAKLTLFLHHRFGYFEEHPPQNLVVLPCELIDKNGEKLKECILNYARLWQLSTSFTYWVNNDITFCNTLVDRIVPGFPKTNIDHIQQKLGYNDQLIVKAEPFHLWVIEGPKWIENRFGFKKAKLNVILTDNLEPYRTRKVRILNGAHTAMVPYGYLHGFEQVREVVENEKAGEFIRNIIFNEIIPTLDLPKTELETYANEVLERFKNPFINHLLLDISLNSVSKFRVRVLPSILVFIDRYGEVPKGLVNAFAYLLLFYKGERNGQTIALNDEATNIEFFKRAWSMESVEAMVTTILGNETFWGRDLAKISNLSKTLIKEIEVKLLVNKN